MPPTSRPADGPSFAIKKRPTQQRARDTYEAMQQAVGLFGEMKSAASAIGGIFSRGGKGGSK